MITRPVHITAPIILVIEEVLGVMVPEVLLITHGLFLVDTTVILGETIDLVNLRITGEGNDQDTVPLHRHHFQNLVFFLLSIFSFPYVSSPFFQSSLLRSS
jgi:hypothetical protein